MPSIYLRRESRPISTLLLPHLTTSQQGASFGAARTNPSMSTLIRSDAVMHSGNIDGSKKHTYSHLVY